MLIKKLLCFKKDKFNIFLVFFALFSARLAISHLGFHVDILSNAGWGEWIYQNGPMNFYANEVWIYSWPTQPPLMNLIYGLDRFLYHWILEILRFLSHDFVPYLKPSALFGFWYKFVVWFDSQKYADTPFSIGYLMSIKIFPIMADMAIAFVIYWFAKLKKIKRPIFWSLLYLLSPFSWYLSALWGQYDQVSFLFLLLSFIFLVKKKLFWAPILFLISFSIKPTSLLFAPLFAFSYFSQKPKIKTILSGVLVSLSIFIASVSVFVNENLFKFIFSDLLEIVFFKAAPRVSTNTFNFWRIIHGDNALGQMTPFLKIPSLYWGGLVFLIIHIIIFLRFKKITLENTFMSIFLIGVGGWVFLTNMLERYVFAGLVALLLVSIYKRGLLKYWLILSIIFWINLYYHWWFPEWLKPLESALTWNEDVLTRLLSIVNVVVFFLALKLSLKKTG